MIKINLIKNYKSYPAVWYTHYLLRRPMKTFEYKWFPFRNETAMVVFAKIMAMIHDHLLCDCNECGIGYGTITYYERPRSSAR
jgi:hypothetical protein